MNPATIYHRPLSEFAFATDATHYVFRLRTGKGEAQSCRFFYADRAAIDEELVRLDSHFAAMDEMLVSREAVGRKMDFLLQEMNRETNTIGSKAGNAEIAHRVVDIKCELEKIREQVQNIE